jgi:tetraacyldisaccharide 4'-kinase
MNWGRAPGFWYQRPGLASTLLRPLGLTHGAVTTHRATTPRVPGPIPVICVGNATVGGTGKTPLVAALATHLARQGRAVAVIARGHGGRFAGPTVVDPKVHTAVDVGDEPLMLAQCMPVVIAKDRTAGVALAAAAGIEVALCDDGLQSAQLYRDWSILTVDGVRGFGNGGIVPAGPLREPWAAALRRVQAVVVMGDDQHALTDRLRKRRAQQGLAPIPIESAHLAPLQPDKVQGKRLVAFAGIGDPARFFRALRQAGAEVVAQYPFPDHYFYRSVEIAGLQAKAQDAGARLITTEKDHARLSPDWAARVSVFSVTACFPRRGGLDHVLPAWPMR